VAGALTEAVRPPGGTDAPVELSLTGGKDSRLVAAALTAARVPFRARTHGFADHPDGVVAGLIAGRLGVEHTVTRPRLPPWMPWPPPNSSAGWPRAA
jgi:asparagine synthase (glutamine-hydrolysing)